MLREFLVTHREEILAEARLRVAERNAPPVFEIELTRGLPAFLDELGEALRKVASKEPLDHAEIEASASQHGNELFQQGLTIAQVVHDYGDLCQVITGLALRSRSTIAIEEFQTLNLCLDDAIAGAVTAFASRRERMITEEGTERLGFLAHEMRNVLNAALLSFASIKRGVVAPGGSTSAIHERSLGRLQSLIDRSLADVRLDAGLHRLDRVPLWEIFEELQIAASMTAQTGDVALVMPSVDRTIVVEADRQTLAAAIANLLQNAFRFTRPGSMVSLRASETATRVLIEVEDECGGLPANPETLLQPFVQQGRDRTGLGLGLSICVKAMRAIGGELCIRDLPGKGCVFIIDLPKQPSPSLPTS